MRATPIKKGEGAVGRLAVTGEPVQIRDIVDEGVYQSRVREILIRLGYPTHFGGECQVWIWALPAPSDFAS